MLFICLTILNLNLNPYQKPTDINSMRNIKLAVHSELSLMTASSPSCLSNWFIKYLKSSMCHIRVITRCDLTWKCYEESVIFKRSWIILTSIFFRYGP